MNVSLLDNSCLCPRLLSSLSLCLWRLRFPSAVPFQAWIRAVCVFPLSPVLFSTPRVVPTGRLHVPLARADAASVVSADPNHMLKLKSVSPNCRSSAFWSQKLSILTFPEAYLSESFDIKWFGCEWEESIWLPVKCRLFSSNYVISLLTRNNLINRQYSTFQLHFCSSIHFGKSLLTAIIFLLLSPARIHIKT